MPNIDSPGELRSPLSKVVRTTPSSSALSPRLRNLMLGRVPQIDKDKLQSVKMEMLSTGDISGLANLALISHDPEIINELCSYPNDPVACQALAIGSATIDDRLKWATQLVGLTPQDPSARLILAFSLYENGRANEAGGQIKDLALDGVDPLGVSESVVRQEAIWKRCGAESNEASILARETGYPRILLASIAQTLVAMDAESDPSLEVIESIGKSDIADKSLATKILLMNAELALKKNAHDIENSNELVAESAGKLRALKVIESRTDLILLDDASNLGREYFQLLESEGLENASRWLLGDSPELMEAFR